MLRLAQGKTEGNRRGHQTLTEDFLFLVGHFEKLRTRSQEALGAAQHEEPGRVQRIVENRYYPLLQGLIQVNHHVAATYQIHPGKRRVTEHVLRRKNTEIANALL